MQQKGEEPVLLTATPSWAAYVIGAPIKDADKNRTARFGVRAVSPNGDMYNENASEISWSDYMDIPYNEVLTDLEVNKAVVKPNEEFTIAMVDELAPKPEKWEILSSATGDVVYSSGSASSVTTKLPDLGLYDVRLTTGGKEIMKRSQLQITQESTGAVPEVTAISADPAKTATGEEVELVYAGRKGEGKVSRALTIADPNMLQIDGNVQTARFTPTLLVQGFKLQPPEQRYKPYPEEHHCRQVASQQLG